MLIYFLVESEMKRLISDFCTVYEANDSNLLALLSTKTGSMRKQLAWLRPKGKKGPMSSFIAL